MNINEVSGRFFARIKRHKKKSALVVVLVCLALWSVFGGQGKGKAQVLSSSTVTRGSIVKALDATGVVTPEVGAIVKTGSRATGIIKKMYVRVGDAVTQGQVIAEIDSREAEASVNEADAAYKRAVAEYQQVLETYPLQIEAAEATLKSARANADYNNLNFQRRKTLVARDLDAQDTLDVARQAMIAANEDVRSATASLERINQEFTRQKESSEQAKLQAEAALTSAKIRLSYTTIVSPLTGMVSQVTAQEGETVVAGLQVANLITVLDPSRLEMWVYVDETDVGQVEPGMPVEFTVDSLPGTIFHGNVKLVYPEPEIRDSIVYYQTVVPLDKETALRLKPEMTTQCRVIVASKDNALVIPNEAVKWVNGEQVVFVVEGPGSVRPVKAVLGMRGIETSEVLEGLEAGDVVATRLVLGNQASSAAQQRPAGPPR